MYKASSEELMSFSGFYRQEHSHSLQAHRHGHVYINKIKVYLYKQRVIALSIYVWSCIYYCDVYFRMEVHKIFYCETTDTELVPRNTDMGF